LLKKRSKMPLNSFFFKETPRNYFWGVAPPHDPRAEIFSCGRGEFRRRCVLGFREKFWCTEED
jgi:hypothetical protein